MPKENRQSANLSVTIHFDRRALSNAEFNCGRANRHTLDLRVTLDLIPSVLGTRNADAQFAGTIG